MQDFRKRELYAKWDGNFERSTNVQGDEEPVHVEEFELNTNRTVFERFDERSTNRSRTNAEHRTLSNLLGSMATFADAHHEGNCAICLERSIDPYELECKHTFCRDCINQYKKHGVNDVCPFCRSPLPPGIEEIIDQCHKMSARIQRYEFEGNKKKLAITHRLRLHHAEKAVKADPKHSIARVYLALGLEDVSQDYEGAIREYRESILFEPNHYLAHLKLGVLLNDVREDYDGAGREYHKAIRCNPNISCTHIMLAYLLSNVREDYDGAIREYREAIRCDPNNDKAHLNLGNLLNTVRKDYDGAAREYREAIRCDPNHSSSHAKLGELLNTVRKDYDGAAREYREAIRCDPNEPCTHFNLGNLLNFVRKDYDGAAREYREAIRCDPNYAKAHCKLGFLLLYREFDDGADYEFREALRCDPSDASALQARAALAAARRVQSKTNPAATADLRVGLGVVLVGLASAKFNGARGTIVSGCHEGRWGVQLWPKGTKAITVKTENITVSKSR